MRARIAMAMLASALLGACTIESFTFTPLSDDGPDASLTDCGDGARQAPEVCDGPDLGDADCTTAGTFTGGTLACDESCAAFDTSGCETATVSVPRLRLPINNTYIGVITASNSLRPTFVWEASNAAAGAEIMYELDYTIDATFATGVTTVSTTTTSYRPPAPLTVAMDVPVGARYYWRVRACVSGVCSANSAPWRVNVGRSDHDVNGDGLADMLMGAYASDSSGESTGSAHLVLGRSAGSFSIDDSVNGVAAGDNFGISVAIAGDVNGDAFADIVIGAPGAGSMDAGRAYVFLGGPDGTFGVSFELAGTASGDNFGLSVAAAGDVNGDGFADVVVGAPSSDIDVSTLNAGRAYIYLGGVGVTFDATPDGILTGAAANDSFGRSVATAGDVNGDGYADVVIGADGNDAGGADAGSARIFLGGVGGSFDLMADGMVAGVAPGDSFGSSVATAGDLNGDGFSDLVVGAFSNDGGGGDSGVAYIYFGASGANFDDGPEATLAAEESGEAFGARVASARDVNGDGFADVVVAAPQNGAGGAGAGRAYVYFGGAGATFDMAVDGTMTGVAAGDGFGVAVASAGDPNGDGFADLVVGAWGNDLNGSLAGAAHLFLGGPGQSFDDDPDDDVLGLAPGDRFGVSVD